VVGCIHGTECAAIAVTKHLARWDPEYSGPSPLSEPGTRIARDLIRRIRPDIAIWYHQPRGRPRLALSRSTSTRESADRSLWLMRRSSRQARRQRPRYAGAQASNQDSLVPRAGKLLLVRTAGLR
jgi:hypothetical protein